MKLRAKSLGRIRQPYYFLLFSSGWNFFAFIWDFFSLGRNSARAENQTGLGFSARAELHPGLNPRGVLPYKGIMGTCDQPGYVFRDFRLKQGIEFIIFCLNQGIDLSIFVFKQDIFSWTINSKIFTSSCWPWHWYQVTCLQQGIQKSEFCLKRGRKISDICLKQGQGMRGRAAPPHPGIYRVPPRGWIPLHVIDNLILRGFVSEAVLKFQPGLLGWK